MIRLNMSEIEAGTVLSSSSHQTTSDTSGSAAEKNPMSNTGPSSFKLSDQTAEWGVKLWTLTFDLPGEKVNKLNRKVMMEFSSVLSQLEELAKSGTSQVDALVLTSGKPGNFIAGADIEMIQKVRSASEAEELSATGQALMSRWEDLPFPTVAAVGGNALGGGCEWALASTAIVMSDDPSAKIGLPEVMLGLIPGMGGCVRLPQKVGLATAFDMILTGKTLSGERAYRAGIIEAVLPRQNFETDVFRWVKANLKALQSGKRLAKEPKLGGMGGVPGALLEKTPMGRAVIIKKAKEGVLSKTRGRYPAPLEAIEVIQTSGLSYGERLRGSVREKALAREAKGFGTVASTEVSKNLIRIFFLNEGVKKSTGVLSTAVAKPSKVNHAAVLGAGVMGGGIAQLLAEKVISVRMKDLNTQALSAGMHAAAQLFQKQVQKKRINKR
jgi:3-hydroxyacyl-CoA dehydrogenase/enoyl-CoA hydratase/3-hydroxybutyryl-CoA epimerase